MSKDSTPIWPKHALARTQAQLTPRGLLSAPELGAALRPRLPHASVSLGLGLAAEWAALAGHTGLANDVGMLSWTA